MSVVHVEGHYRKDPRTGQIVWVRPHSRRVINRSSSQPQSQKKKTFQGPTEDAVKLPQVQSPYGVLEGVHTGGAWLVGDEVWKPLTARNCRNCPEGETLEAVVLEEMAGEDLFPRNWRVEQANGKKWLVRHEAIVIGEPDKNGNMWYDMGDIDPELAQRVINAIRNLNQRGWTIGDDIVLAYDPSIEDYFILDLSNASRDPRANDNWRVNKFLKTAGFDNLVKLRKNAMDVQTIVWGQDDGDWYPYVYASMSRPISRMWAKFPDDIYLYDDPKGGDRWSGRPWTWVLSKKPLPDELLDKYELMFAFSSRP